MQPEKGTVDIRHSDELGELAAAVAAFQGDVKNPEKKRTAKVKGVAKSSGKAYEYDFNYADIGDGLEVVRPLLAKHGLAIMQPTSMDGGVIVLHTWVMHKSGQWMEGRYPVCKPGAHQDMGAAMSYSRRHSLFAMLGVAAEEDIDAQGGAESAAPERASRQPQKSHTSESNQGGVRYTEDDSAAHMDGMIEEIKQLSSVTAVEDYSKQNAGRYGRLQPSDQQKVSQALRERKAELNDEAVSEA